MCVCVCYLQGFDQLLSSGDVGNVDGGAESIQHLHFLEDVLTTRGADDQQLAALKETQNFSHSFTHILRQLLSSHIRLTAALKDVEKKR